MDKTLTDHLKHHGNEPAAPKIDRLASYNAHRVAFWSNMAEICAWRADCTEGDLDEKTIRVYLQVKGAIGCLEMA